MYQKNTCEIKRKLTGSTSWFMATDSRSAFINLTMLETKVVREIKNDTLSSNTHQSNSLQKRFYFHDEHIKKIEKLYESKSEISLEDLLKSRESVWLVGGPGSGKSTLCQHIIFRWRSAYIANTVKNLQQNSISLGNSDCAILQDEIEDEPVARDVTGSFFFDSDQKPLYKLVVWIKLRELKNYLTKLPPELYKSETDHSVLTATAVAFFLLNQLSLTEREKRDFDIYQLGDVLEKEAENIFYVLDGYDEIVNFSTAEDQNEVTDVVLNQFLLKQPHIFVTSRPYFDVPDGLSRKIFQRVELLGFSYNNILSYIDKHFNNDRENVGYITLKQLLRNNINLRGIAHIPANIEILCALMTEGCENPMTLLSQATVTELYQLISIYLIKRYLCYNPLANLDDMSIDDTIPLHTQLTIPQCFEWAKDNAIIISFGALALQGLCKEQRIFTLDDIIRVSRLFGSQDKSEKKRSVLLIQRLRHLGFIRGLIIDEHDDVQDFHSNGEFLHLTLQEYLAAEYIAIRWDHGRHELIPGLKDYTPESLIQTYKYHPTFTMVWPFVAGLLSKKSSLVLNSFFDFLIMSPDLLGIGETLLYMRCLNEVNDMNCIPSVSSWLEKCAFLLKISSLKFKEYPDLSNPLLTRITIELHNCPAIFNNPLIRNVLIRHLNEDKYSCHQALRILKQIALPIDKNFIERIIHAVNLFGEDEKFLGSIAADVFVLSGVNKSEHPDLESFLKTYALSLIEAGYTRLASDTLLSIGKLGISDLFLISYFTKSIADESYDSGEMLEYSHRDKISEQFVEIYDNIKKEDNMVSIESKASLLRILANKPKYYLKEIYELSLNILLSETIPVWLKKPVHVFFDVNHALRKISLTRVQKQELIPHIIRHMQQAEEFLPIIAGLPLLNCWAINDNDLLPNFEVFFKDLRSTWMSKPENLETRDLSKEGRENFLLGNCWIYIEEFKIKFLDRYGSIINISRNLERDYMSKDLMMIIAISKPIEQMLYAWLLSLQDCLSFEVFMNLCLVLLYNKKEDHNVAKYSIQSWRNLTSTDGWYVSCMGRSALQFNGLVTC